jgi:DNA-binding transcriptional ArsR family regulator
MTEPRETDAVHDADVSGSLNNLMSSWTIIELRMMASRSQDNALTFNSILYLDMISFTEDCTVTKLADILKVSKPTVTSKINELVDMGLVVKTRSDTDGRVSFLDLSPDVMFPYDNEIAKIRHVVDKLNEMYSGEDLLLFCNILDKASELLMDDV